MFNSLAAMWRLSFRRSPEGSGFFSAKTSPGQFLIPAFLTFLVSACAQVAPPVERDFVADMTDFSAVESVAILPLDNWTNRPNAGEITAQLLASEFYSQGLFQLAPESSVAAALGQMSDGTAGGGSPFPDPKALADKLDVDAVLTGSVSEYGYKHTLKEEPAVGFNVRLIRRSDGRVIWSSSQSEVGDGKRAESVNQLAQRVIQRMVAPLAAQFRAP